MEDVGQTAPGHRLGHPAACSQVGEGVGTGPKAATTIAFTTAGVAARHPQAPRLLDGEWLARWRRSSSKTPASVPDAERTAFEQAIEKHPQFVVR